MILLLLVIAGILLELIVLVGGIYFILKYFSKINTPVISNSNITSDIIRDGVKSAIQEITYEEEQEKLFEKKMRTPDHIYSTIQHDEPVISDGDLVPYGLTTQEKATLDMFYNKDD